MPRRTNPASAPLVSVSLLFERHEVAALDHLALAAGLDRGRAVRCALGLLAALGPDVAAMVGAGVSSGARVTLRFDAPELA